MGSPAGAEENAPSSGAPAEFLAHLLGPATAAAAPAPSSTTARASRLSRGATRLIGRRQSVS